MTKAIVVLGVVAAFFGVASRANATTITGYSPANGATVTGPRPAFTINSTSQNSSDFFIRLTTSPDVIGGQLFGGILLEIPSSGGSVEPYADLAPGVYYYQWTYNDYGCFTQVDPASPTQFVQPDCHPDPQTSCPMFTNGACTGPVITVTVTAPSPPPTSDGGGGTPPASGSSVDTLAPLIHAYAASGRRGTAIHLRFSVSDNSGRVALGLGVFLRSTVLMRRQFPLQKASGVYYVSWMPKRRGTFQFCALAKDAAENQSRVSCARVVIR